MSWQENQYLTEKACRVIESCKTLEQFNAAARFATLAGRRIKWSDRFGMTVGRAMEQKYHELTGENKL